jgi:hypothetical protein
MASTCAEGRANESPLPNMRCIIDYGPDRLPMYSNWQLLPDCRPTDDSRSTCVRITVVQPDDGPLTVRVAALGLKHLGVRPGAIIHAVMELIHESQASLSDRQAA